MTTRAVLRLHFMNNLHLIIVPTLQFINAFSNNNIVLLSESSVSITHKSIHIFVSLLNYVALIKIYCFTIIFIFV